MLQTSILAQQCLAQQAGSAVADVQGAVAREGEGMGRRAGVQKVMQDGRVIHGLRAHLVELGVPLRRSNVAAAPAPRAAPFWTGAISAR